MNLISFISRKTGLIALGSLCIAGGQGMAQETGGWSKDPAKIVGSESCQECHKAAATVWEKTHHHSTYVNLPQNAKAIAIAGKLGIQAIDLTTSEKCSQCHFTVQKSSDKPKAISGISCESCHGAAGDWILMHSNTAKPKEARFAQSAAKGMNRPGDYYSLFKNCMECHTAPDEDLVNKGGHPAGSNFELVAWSQGEMRHTFSTDETKNELPTPQKKRLLFVLGRALELEYALRGLTKITDPAGAYSQAMIARMQTAVQYLQQINQVVGGKHAGISGIITALGGNVTLDNAAATAEAVKKANQEFLAKCDGSDLEALDKYIPVKMKGTPAPYRP